MTKKKSHERPAEVPFPRPSPVRSGRAARLAAVLARHRRAGFIGSNLWRLSCAFPSAWWGSTTSPRDTAET